MLEEHNTAKYYQLLFKFILSYGLNITAGKIDSSLSISK